jgi:serine protease Do
MTKKRLLYLTLIIATLTIGVVIGTIVSGGVKAGEQQKAQALVIPDPVSLSNAFTQISASVSPAVVNINTEAAPENNTVRNRNDRNNDRNNENPNRNNRNPREFDPFDFFNFFGGPDAPDRNEKVRNLGTGFIVDKSGYIVTNHHVVDKATKIMVRLEDKSEFQGKLVGSDDDTDLAVIKIEAGRDLPVAKLGNSDGVKVGDWVLAIGSPFSLDHTVTHGIISAKGRTDIGGARNDFQSFLQTDAAINPGNSGGPLVNMSGEVIGINTAIVSGTDSFAGLGFALPSNTAVKVYNQLSQHGKVTRGSIGISYTTETDPTALESYGVKAKEAIIIGQVYPGSPAAKAGLQSDDIITEINGSKVTKGNQLQDVIVDSPVGSTVKLGFIREGRPQTVSVSIGDRADVLSEDATASNVPDRPRSRGGAAPATQSRLGIQVQSLTAQMSRQFSGLMGVEVTHVEPNSVADEAGVEEGMVIDGLVTGGRTTPIANVADFQRVESQLRSGSSVTLRVKVPNDYTNTIRIPMKVK